MGAARRSATSYVAALATFAIVWQREREPRASLITAIPNPSNIRRMRRFGSLAGIGKPSNRGV